MHFHVVKLAHVLSLEAEVSEAERYDVVLFDRNVPNTQLRGGTQALLF